MPRKPVTVQEYREAQEILKNAIDLHEKKDFQLDSFLNLRF